MMMGLLIRRGRDRGDCAWLGYLLSFPPLPSDGT